MENAAPAAGAALSRVRQLQHGQLEHDSDDMQLAAARSSRKALTIAAALASSAAADGGVAAAAALSTPTASALSTTDSDFAGSDRGTVDGDDKVAALTAACRTILECLGEDPTREGLVKTPARMAKALLACTSGYADNAKSIVSDALFECDSREMVLVRGIDVNSMCEHHVLPFFGKATVAYLPTGRVVGLSKLARLVDLYAKRLQIQERLTRQVAEAVMEHVGAAGVAVMIECTHMCMSMRGVEKHGAVTASTCFTGAFQTDATKRLEFLLAARGDGGGAAAAALAAVLAPAPPNSASCEGVTASDARGDGGGAGDEGGRGGVGGGGSFATTKR